MINIILSDTHFGVKQNSITWMNSQIGFLHKEFIPAIKHYSKLGPVRVIHCGDVFDSRSSINPMVATAVREAFIEIAKLCDVYIIAGNHDFYSPNEDDISALDLTLNNIKNLTIVRDKSVFLFNEDLVINTLLIPWYEFDKKENVAKLINDHKGELKYIFTHTDLTRLSDENKRILKDVTVYSGHIHQPQREDNLVTLGSTFPLTFADCNSDRGFYILNDNTNELSFVKAKNVIKFWRFYNKEIFDIDIEKYKNDYIEFHINKLNFTNERYTEQISKLTSKIHNSSVVPNIEKQENSEQEINFTNYNIKEICEANIPDPLKSKFKQLISISEENPQFSQNS